MTRALLFRLMSGLVGLAACGLLLASGTASAQVVQPAATSQVPEVAVIENTAQSVPATTTTTVAAIEPAVTSTPSTPAATKPQQSAVETASETAESPVRVSETPSEEIPVEIGEACAIEKLEDGTIIESAGCNF